MIDSYGRTIDYLRISVTDRCNLRCTYCMPPEGVPLIRHEDVLTFEEIAEVARAAAAMGITKVRLTGGEPLVRRNVVRLVEMLAAIDGIRDLAMTTNGTLLAAHAWSLAAAGLRRVNVSLDAVDQARYAAITRGGDVRQVLAGIDAARQAGLTPIRLNCVVEADASELNAQEVARFAAASGLEVRFIRRINLPEGVFAVVERARGDGEKMGTGTSPEAVSAPSRLSASEPVPIFSPLGGDCPRCNRLRLSSDGQIRPCLLSNLCFSVRRLGAAEALAQAVAAKPQAGSACTDSAMHAIGG